MTGTAKGGATKARVAIMVAIIMLMTFFFSVTLNMVSPLITIISEKTGWSLGQVGQFNAIIFFLMGAFALVGSPIMDRFGTKKTALLSLALAAVGNIMAIACGEVYALHFLGKFLYGCAWGLFFLIPGAVITYWLPAKTRATMMGLRCTVDILGCGVTYYVVLPVYRALGESWQMTFMAFGLAFAVIFVLYLLGLGVNEAEERERAERAARQAAGEKTVSGLAAAAKSPQVWLMCATLCGIQFVYNGYSSYLPAYLQLEKGFSVDAASNITGMMSIFGMVSGVATGAISTALGRRFVFTWPMMLLCVAGSLGCLFVDGAIPLLACAALLGVAMTGYMTGYTTIPGELPGADTNFYNGAVAIIYSIGFMVTYGCAPVVSLVQKCGGSMRAALLVFCVPGAIGLVTSFFIRDTGARAGKGAMAR